MIIRLLICALVGAIAGKLMNTRKPWYINIILGVAGGYVGGFLFGLIGLGANSFIGGIIVSVVGACAVIAICRALVK